LKYWEWRRNANVSTKIFFKKGEMENQWPVSRNLMPVKLLVQAKKEGDAYKAPVMLDQFGHAFGHSRYGLTLQTSRLCVKT
jgi:hypothetical protein